jgi:hypothetical protein
MSKAVQFPGIDSNGKRDAATIPFSCIKQIIVAGAAAATNIAIAGIKLTDLILAAVNLTDLTNVLKAAVVAELDCGTKGDGKLDTIVKASAAGAAGNSKKIALVYDAGALKAGSAAYANSTLTLTFGPTSTVGDMEALILANKVASGIETKTGGTGATVLIEASAFAATSLAGGSDAISAELPAVTEAGQIQFPNCDTTNKKVLVMYADLG